MLAAVSWSGGKDCCLALHRARVAGHDIRFLVTVFDETGERSRSHGVPVWAMENQAAALGLTLIRPSAGWENYEAVFIASLRDLAARGVAAMVFGDIDLQPHRDWEEKVCAAAGLRAILPLWQEDRAALADELLSLGVDPLVICTDDRHLPPSFCGRRYDRAFLDDLPPAVDVCGENGEFHTFHGRSRFLDRTRSGDRRGPKAGRPVRRGRVRLSLRVAGARRRDRLTARRGRLKPSGHRRTMTWRISTPCWPSSPAG